MSVLLSADYLNDFISPGVACIKPVETLPVEDIQNPSVVAPPSSENPVQLLRRSAEPLRGHHRRQTPPSSSASRSDIFDRLSRLFRLRDLCRDGPSFPSILCRG